MNVPTNTQMFHQENLPQPGECTSCMAASSHFRVRRMERLSMLSTRPSFSIFRIISLTEAAEAPR